MSTLMDDVHVSPEAPRRSLGKAAMAIAAIVCAAGLSVAAWSVYENTRPIARPKSASDTVRDQARTSRPPAPTAVAAGEAPKPPAGGSARRTISSDEMRDNIPEFVDNPTFTPVANADQATQIIASLATASAEQSTKIDGLTQTPLQTSEQINSALTRFLGPLSQGEITNGPEFLTSNGGRVPESGKIPAIVGKIAELLKFCELDIAHLRVRRAPKEFGPVADMLPKLPPGAVPMMINQNNLGDGREVGSLTMPLAGLLQGSMDGVPADGPRLEVQVPAKFKDPALASQRFVLGIVLAQNTKTARWIPVNLQFHSNDKDAIKTLSGMLRTRPPKDSGGPAPKAASDRG